MTCLSSIKFSLTATVVRNYRKNINDEGTVPGGYFEEIYDPVTNQEISVWVQSDLIPDDGKPDVTSEIPCMIVPAYTVSQANDLQYKQTRIIDTERLVMKIPSRYHVYTTDRVIAIKNRMGELVYEDDQVPFDAEGKKPAAYNIVGVLPVTDPFGNVVERQVQLDKVN